MCVRMGASWRDGTVFFFAVLRDVAMTGAHDFRARAHHDLRLLEWLFDLFHPLLEFSLGLQKRMKMKQTIRFSWYVMSRISNIRTICNTLKFCLSLTTCKINETKALPKTTGKRITNKSREITVITKLWGQNLNRKLKFRSTLST